MDRRLGLVRGGGGAWGIWGWQAKLGIDGRGTDPVEGYVDANE